MSDDLADLLESCRQIAEHARQSGYSHIETPSTTRRRDRRKTAPQPPYKAPWVKFQPGQLVYWFEPPTENNNGGHFAGRIVRVLPPDQALRRDPGRPGGSNKRLRPYNVKGRRIVDGVLVGKRLSRRPLPEMLKPVHRVKPPKFRIVRGKWVPWARGA